MKKNLIRLRLGIHFACILMLSVCFTLNAHAEDLKNMRLSVTFTNVSLPKALEIIGQKSSLGVTFNDQDLAFPNKISYEAKNKLLPDIMHDILNNTPLKYRFYNNNIVIYKEKQSILTGKVSDANGLPLKGISVTEKGTAHGTTTATNGSFSLKVNANSAVLIFSSIGFITVTRTVTINEPVAITLLEEVSSLNELVVVGYGTQKKKDLTGAIAHLDMAGKEMTAATDLVQALQGVTPGLNAKSGSKAGEAGGISIRGKTSLSASDDPLIVLDGIIFNGTTADLNINDIASIDVLKDASSAAVYGSRSANGVIVITSKVGNSDKPQFNFNAYYGSQDLANTDMTKVMNGQQYAEHLADYYYQQKLYDWYKTGPTSAELRPAGPDLTNRELLATTLRTQEEKDNYLQGKEINWLDEVFRTAPMQSYSLSVSGRTPRTNYYLSAAYVNQQGIILNDQFKRTTFFAKFENKINDWLKIEFDPMYTHRDYSGLETSLSDALISSPLGNMYNSVGVYPTYIAGESYAYHPLGHLNVIDSEPKDNLNLIMKAKVQVPGITGLNLETNYSRNYIFNRKYQYFPQSTAEGSQVGGQGLKTNSNETKWLMNNTLTYKRVFNVVHSVDVTLLHSEESINGEGTTASGIGYSSEKLGYNALELAETQTSSSSAYREYTRSFLGRVNYAFKDRYLLTGTIRRDGYSGFGSNRKWGSFPSVSVGWIASEEAFLKKSDLINFLKLRVSYGVNGNQGIGTYKSQSQMASTNTVFDGITYVGLYSSSMGNDNLGWEKTNSTNIGLDYRILNNRISGSVDVYRAITTDVLVQRAIPAITGNSSVWDNIGGIENKGIEFSIDTKNIKSDDFSWNSAVAFTLNRNKITKLYGNVTQDIGNGWFVGKSIYAIYGYETDGIWQEKDLYDKTIMKDYYPGQYKIKDLNGDGIISADADRKILGSTDPNYRISLNNEFRYKNFSLGVFLNSIMGGNGYYMANNASALVSGGTDKAYRLNRTAVLPYWTPLNEANNVPGIYNNPKIAPGVYQNKSFVRLQDVNFSYSFSSKMVKKAGLSTLRVYASGKNLYTWTKWSGWDPDVANPLIKSFILGINTSF